MGSSVSHAEDDHVVDREWLRLGSELNLIESALYSASSSAASGGSKQCKYCADLKHKSSECTLAARQGLIELDLAGMQSAGGAGAPNANASNEKPIKELGQVNALEGLVEARSGDKETAGRLLTDKLFAFSLQSSSFSRVASHRMAIVERLRGAVDRLALQTPALSNVATGKDAEAPDAGVVAATRVNKALFDALMSTAAATKGDELTEEGWALRGDIVRRVLALVEELPTLSLFAGGPQGSRHTEWLAGLEDWLNLVSNAGRPDLADRARTALLHLAMCTGSLQAVLQSVLASLDDADASFNAAALARIMRFRTALPLNSALLHDGTSNAAQLLGAWAVDELKGEDKLRSQDALKASTGTAAKGASAAAAPPVPGAGIDMVGALAGIDMAEQMRMLSMLSRSGPGAVPIAGGAGAGAGDAADKDDDDADAHGFSAVASDGRFLYMHSKRGLRKVGTGYNGTGRGRHYAWRPQYLCRHKCWLAAVGDRLYVRSSDLSVAAKVLNSFDLTEVGELTNPALGVSTIEAPSPMLTCGRLLYFVREKAAVAAAVASEGEAETKATDAVFEAVKYDPTTDRVVGVVALSGPAPGPMHKITCFGCHRVGFTGIAFKCSECESYFQCEACHLRAQAKIKASGKVPVRPKNTRGGNRKALSHADWHPGPTWVTKLHLSSHRHKEQLDFFHTFCDVRGLLREAMQVDGSPMSVQVVASRDKHQWRPSLASRAISWVAPPPHSTYLGGSAHANTGRWCVTPAGAATKAHSPSIDSCCVVVTASSIGRRPP